jgi:RNA polymerase sigma-70 factor, ECF subfamily
MEQRADAAVVVGGLRRGPPREKLSPVSTASTAPGAELAASLREHEKHLWGLCYRLTGSASEADDLVQDTFVRALERPPARTGEPLRPWLTKVALNLGRDALRRRRRRGYVGPWLPEPIETEGATPSAEVEGPGGAGTEARYDLLESVSFAFLLALEALTPQQRAVLLLRDVFDYSVKETARALGLSEPNVKTTHHRARRALEPYEKARCRPTIALAAEAQAALQRFLHAMSTNDAAALEALLAADARALSDGGGEQHAARKPVVGKKRVASMYLGLARTSPPPLHAEIRVINGLPALVAELPERGERMPRRFTLQCAVGEGGRITAVYSVVAARKLGALRPFG